jgi:DNA-binding beta-propeller fold protein YncE
LLAAAICLSGTASAQQNGYVNGIFGIYSFDPVTGAVVASFSGDGTASPFAVSANATSLYTAGSLESGKVGVIYVVSGTSGQVTGSVAVPEYQANSIALTSDGTKAFVPTQFGVSVIDTTTLAVIGTIAQSQGGAIDVALSPDDSTLYMSVNCASMCGPKGSCPVNMGVCAFSAATLALEWEVAGVSGLLSVSSDGTSLYAADVLVGGKPVYPLNAINAATHAVTNLDVSNLKDGTPVRIATDPASHYAVVVEQGSYSGDAYLPASAYLLNTATNKFVQTLFASAPGNMVLTNTAGAVAFAPNGKSVWMLLTCYTPGSIPNCSDQSGAVYLAGFSLPSGEQISFQKLGGEYATQSEDRQSIAFPQ